MLLPYYRGADKSLARPGRKQAIVSVRMVWISFGALPCRKKKNLTTARVSMLLKSRTSLTCFRACFLPGWLRTYQYPGTSRKLLRGLYLHMAVGVHGCSSSVTSR